MTRQHLVRLGAMGQVGRFTAVDAVRYTRHARVVVRTPRGLEVGEILAAPQDGDEQIESEGSILRGVTVEDDLLLARLQRTSQAAYTACSARLAQLGLGAALVDVEPLFDGQTLVFYFLGEMTEELETLTAELAEVYDSQAQLRRFAETVTNGCGPQCGTEAGGGCQSCDTGCAIAGACNARK